MTSLYAWSGGPKARFLQWLLTLAAGIVALLLGRDLWVGSWKAALDWGTGSLILAGPVSAGASALAYSAMTARGWDSFVAGTRRGWASWFGPLLGAWLLGCAAMVSCILVALGTASALGAAASPTMLWAVPLVSLTVAAEAGIGAVIGASVRRAFSIPLAVISTFLLESLSVGGTIPGVFRTGGVTGELAGETYDFRVLLLQAGVCAAIALACVLALASQVFLWRPAPAFLAVAGCLALVIPPWWALVAGGHDRYANEAAPRLVCTGAAPEVCLSEDTRRPLAALSRELHRQAAPLVTLGITLPDRFVQDLPSGHNESDGLVIFVDHFASSAKADPRSVALALATPRACPAFFSNVAPIRALQAQGLMADWIASKNDVPGIGVDPTSDEGRWLAMPVSRQAQWLSSTYAALSDCRLDDLTIPFT